MRVNARKLARQRGVWNTARYLRKHGVPFERALGAILGVREIPTLTDSVPKSNGRGNYE